MKTKPSNDSIKLWKYWLILGIAWFISATIQLAPSLFLVFLDPGAASDSVLANSPLAIVIIILLPWFIIGLIITSLKMYTKLSDQFIRTIFWFGFFGILFGTSVYLILTYGFSPDFIVNPENLETFGYKVVLHLDYVGGVIGLLLGYVAGLVLFNKST